MKLVLAVHQFFPAHSAGTEVLTLQTATELQRRGHAVEVWTGHPTPSPASAAPPTESYRYQGLPVVRFNHGADFLSPRTSPGESEHDSPRVAGLFRDQLGRWRPDVVHFTHFMRFSAAPVDVCAEMGIPTVFTPTDFWMICPTSRLHLHDDRPCAGPDAHGANCVRHLAQLRSPPAVARLLQQLPDAAFVPVIRAARIARRWDRRYAPIVAAVADRRASLLARLTRLDQVLAPSRTMEAMLLRHGLDPRRLRFVPYGIDLHPFGEAPPRQPGDRLRVGYVGTLVRHKGAHVLCEAVRLLPPDLRVDVVIHGDPTAVPGYAARLRRIARGDPRVHFAGTFPLSAIAGVLARLDVLVVPSLWYESTPLVIYAAQAARTPVFATGLAGMAEVVHHEQNGLLFERGDAPGLAELIHRCARDRSLLARLAGNAVVPRSIESFADELEGIYREVSRPGR